MFFQSIKSELKICYQLLKLYYIKANCKSTFASAKFPEKVSCLHVTAFFDTIVYDA